MPLLFVHKKVMEYSLLSKHLSGGLISISRIQLMGRTSTGCGVSGTDLVGLVSSLDIPQGTVTQALTLFGEVRSINWCLRRSILGECRRSPRHFGECWARLGYGPAPGPTLKKRPRDTLLRLVGRRLIPLTFLLESSVESNYIYLLSDCNWIVL